MSRPTILVNGHRPPPLGAKANGVVTIASTATLSLQSTTGITSVVWAFEKVPVGSAAAATPTTGLNAKATFDRAGEYILTCRSQSGRRDRVVLRVYTAAKALLPLQPEDSTETMYEALDRLTEAVDGWPEASIADGAVTTAKLAPNAVTAAKIAGDAVTSSKLAANAVTTSKILDANVTTAKLADAAVTDAKIDTTGGLGTYLAKRSANLPSAGAFDNKLVELQKFLPTWDPSWDSGCVAWYLVDENTTRVSGAASVIPNRVRSGVDPLIMSTAGSRPTYEAAGWMGQPSILLDGTDDYLTADGLSGYASGNDLAWSVAMAIQPSALVDLDTFFSFGLSTLDTAFHEVYMDSGGNLDVYRHDDASGSQLRQGALSAVKQIVVVVFTGTALTVLINDTVVINNLAMNVGVMTVDRFTLGALGRSSYANFGGFRFRELVMFSRALTVGAETTRIYNNLVARNPTF